MYLLKTFASVALLSSAAILLSGVSQCAPPTPQCFFAEPAAFLSVDELECGRSPDGMAMCHWSLSFSEGQFTWKGSDYAEFGTYTCDGDTVTGTTSTTTFAGTWDATQGVLTWNNVTYLPE